MTTTQWIALGVCALCVEALWTLATYYLGKAHGLAEARREPEVHS